MKILLLPVVAAVAMAISPGATSSTVGHDANNVVDEAPKSNTFWWPEQLDLSQLRAHSVESNPYGDNFNYADKFESLDLNAVKTDIREVLTSSQPWWPADYGHYGPFFIRMAWHAAGTYRTIDGRGGAGGGQQRFDPLNSWPDNANLDKARRLLWPVKQKYGRSISWGDLIALTGNVALEDMGFTTFGFAGGRADDWEPDNVYWGPEEEMLTDQRRDGKGNLKGPLAAVEMGLIYVNPVGPHGNPDPLLAAKDIRMSFGRMAMNDEEIVALIAGGHTFGKAHGAKKADCLGKEPAAAALEDQGLGWKNKCGKGNAEDTMTSGLEGAWTVTPTQWTTNYLDNLFSFEWKQTKSPAGAIQWVPTSDAAASMVPDAHVKGKRHAPIMFTTDLALKEDPAFREIAQRFHNDPKAFELAFAKAWFKLNHRDLGPKARYLGNEIPDEDLIWQDPIPEVDHPLISVEQASSLKKTILDSKLTVQELVRVAWAAAASYRDTDMRGGVNGARIALAPQKDWKINNPKEVQKVLSVLKDVQQDFNSRSSKAKVSLADMIVLGGAAAIEKAASDAGVSITVPFAPGRADTTQAMTDIDSFAVLEPTADAFRNYYTRNAYRSPAVMMVDQADKLALTVPEMTVLLGGMRALNVNADGSAHGVLTTQPGKLTNDFFVNLLDMSTQWRKSDNSIGLYEGVDRASGKIRWTATPVDLIYGSNTELRAVAEVYGAADAQNKFVNDFVTAWVKVMRNDRFDLK
ncbi:catalase/peroxidase HPI [Aestuariibacter sp. A3R04]|uniref:catalase/peroxidase HPI n=1 Tax=Aestuariibacter sp. A3R04 TaxID=2841571 RepID=UPI001C0805FF|nr:catalase/peroxidase HPI [Aestuariibacter sp. A3R04]MBU3021828.1 catalase/peroxidase HPI [Aestuariibacter sp. A3R04]